ncbi:hypothetical protein OQA88_1489 [Cercophora sp. LCS_1]
MSTLTYPDSLTKFTHPLSTYLQQNPTPPFDGIATATVVINPHARVLLVQRAPHDSMPNRWEVPGGAVDLEDETVLHGAVRELREEGGLVATKITHWIPEQTGDVEGYVFTNRAGTKTFCRFAFGVEVEDWESVKLDPNEHQDYVWASEEEVSEGKVGERELVFTVEETRRLILEGFRLWREAGGG